MLNKIKNLKKNSIMQNNILTYQPYSIPEVEERLTRATMELEEYSKHQGMQDGKKENEISEQARSEEDTTEHR